MSWNKYLFFYFGSLVPMFIGLKLVQEVGMRHGVLPFSYLGVPIFKGKPKSFFSKTLCRLGSKEL